MIYIEKRKEHIPPFFDAPMPREEFMRRELQEFARVFAVTVLASLVFAGIVYPWSNAWACAPFVAVFLAGAWLVTGRAK